MPVAAEPRGAARTSWCRLSSFGFSGTIAHGAFGGVASSATGGGDDPTSLYRGRAALHAGRAANVFLKRASVRGQTSLLLGGEKSEPRRAAIIGAAFSRNTSSSL